MLFASRAFAGGVEVDGSTPTTLDAAPNGVPIVNIANPNTRGLSHNSYRQFNVDPSGLILNNAQQNVVDTRLGGQILGNSNLTNPAQVILNEVTSTHSSVINGFTEVAGQGADVVIANPNGISVNGGGFLNAPRVTLTTGVPEFDAFGGLSGYDVRGGAVTIDGSGLNNLEVDATSIYSHYLQLNAKLHARDLDVALGANQVDYSGRKIIRKSPGLPQRVLLDSSALGGMYAGKIRLVGTAVGLGVNLPPEVIASSGGIEISADGRIRLQQLDAAGEIRVASGNGIESGDTVYSQDRLQFEAGDAIEITGGMVAAADAVHLDAGRIDNAGSLVAGVEADGSLNDRGEMSITANRLTNMAEMRAATTLDIDAGEFENRGLIGSDAGLTVDADNLTNAATLFAGGSMELRVRDELHNTAAASILAVNDLLLAADGSGGRSASILNEQGSIQTLYGDITIHANRFDNLGFAELDYDLVYYDLGHAREVDDIDAAKTLDLEYSSGYTKHNSKARDRWVREILKRLGRQAPELYADNAPRISGQLNARFRAIETRLIDYSITAPALLDSGGGLSLHVGEFDNDNAIVAAGGDLLFDISGDYRNRADTATEQVVHYDYSVRAKHSRNHWSEDKYSSEGRAGYIPIARSLTVGADAVTQAGGNVGGHIGGQAGVGGALAGQYASTGFDADRFDTASLVLPSGDFGLFVRSADPDSRYLVELNPRFTRFGSFINSDYLLERLDFSALETLKRLGDAFYESKLVRDSVFAQTGRRYLDPALTSDNAQFKYLMDNALATRETLELAPGVALDDTQINALTADIVWLVETEIDGQKVLVPRVYLAHTRSGELRGGRLLAGGALGLQVANLDNRGLIEAVGDMQIDAGQAISNRGSIRSDGDVDLAANGSIENVSGRIRGGNVYVESREGDIVNRREHETYRYRNRDVDFDTELVGEAGRIDADGQLRLQAGGDIVVSGSQVAGGEVELQASSVSIESAAVAENFRSGDDDDYFSESSLRHLTSTVHGDDIVILSSGAARVSGSALRADRALRIEAGDLEIAAVEDRDTYASQSRLEGIASERITAERRLRTKNRGAELNAPTVVLITEQGDIDLTGSDLEAGLRLSMQSAGDIRLQAGHDGSLDERHKIERGLFSGGDVYRETEDLDGQMTRSAVLSEVRAGSVDLVADGVIDLQGVAIGVDDGFDASARGISVRNAEESKVTWSKHTEISVGFDDLAENLTSDLDELIEEDDGKLSLRLAEARYEHAESVDTETRVVESRIAAGDIRMRAGEGVLPRDGEAGGDILIEGSELTADGTIALDAAGQVALLDAEETKRGENSTQSGTATLSLNLQNEYDQLSRAIKAVKQAERDLRHAEEAYSDYQQALDAQEHELERLQLDYIRGRGFVEQADLDDFERRLERLRGDGEYYQANIALAAVTLTSKTTALIRQGGKAAASSGALGFNLSADLDIDALEREVETYYRQGRASTLAAGTIDFDAGTTAAVRGSNLYARQRVDIDAAQIDIQAGVSSNTAEEGSRRVEYGYSWNLLGDASSLEERELGGSFGVEGSESRSESRQYRNAQLHAGTIHLNARQTAEVHGAEIRAGESLVIEAGDLEVASVQDFESSHSRSLGGSASNAGAGPRTAEQDSESLRTLVTSLSGQQVAIQVENNSEIRGAVIAATDDDGRDNGQLAFSTGTLNAGSLINISEATNRSLDLSAGETSTLDYQDDATNERTKSLATIGSGELAIGDAAGSDTRMLNSDIDNTEVSIYELESTRGLSGELDTRLLSESGRSQIAEDWLKSGMIADTIEMIVKTEHVGIVDFFTETDKKHESYEALKQLVMRDPKFAAMLQDPSLTPGQKEQMANLYTGTVMRALGKESYENLIVAITDPNPDGERPYGFYSEETGNAYLNDPEFDNTYDLLATAGHEAAHAYDDQEGLDFSKLSDDERNDINLYADSFGENLADYTAFALDFHGYDGLAQSNDHTGNDSDHVRSNNLENAGLDKEKGDFYLNYEDKKRYTEYINALFECDANGGCTPEQIARWQPEVNRLLKIDEETDARLEQACRTASSAVCRTEVEKLRKVLYTYRDLEDRRELYKEGIAAEYIQVGTLYGKYRSEAMSENTRKALASLPVDTFTGTVDLTLIAAKAAVGDDTAKQQMALISESMYEFAKDPAGTIERNVASQLEEAQRLRAQGDIDAAEEIESRVYIEGAFAIAGSAGGGFSLLRIGMNTAKSSKGISLPSGTVATIRSTEWFEKTALQATKNADSNKLILGHFAKEGTSYQKVAAHYDATYFKIDDWKSLTAGLTQDEIWKINETFLKQQLRQGKKVLFSHDPDTARPGSFFEKEVRFIKELGYKFEKKNQWTWEASR